MFNDEKENVVDNIAKEVQATLAFEDSNLTKDEIEALKRNIQKIKNYNKNGEKDDNRKKYK